MLFFFEHFKNSNWVAKIANSRPTIKMPNKMPMIPIDQLFSFSFTYVKVLMPIYENTIASPPCPNIENVTLDIVLPYGERLYQV